jgi:hypothetical protein
MGRCRATFPAPARPGLILTPPAEQADTDEGYLSASEVAALKLDADWVILSACNTAAGARQGAKALSGLARAFFYAGTRGRCWFALGGGFNCLGEADHLCGRRHRRRSAAPRPCAAPC